MNFRACFLILGRLSADDTILHSQCNKPLVFVEGTTEGDNFVHDRSRFTLHRSE